MTESKNPPLDGVRSTRLYRGALAAIVVLALVLRLGVVTQYGEHHPLAQAPQIDEASYDAWAQDIAGGEWIGEGVFFQEPLYAYALGAVYATGGVDGEEAASVAGARTRARWLQAILGALGILPVAWLTLRLFGVLPSLGASLLLALHRPALLAPALLLKPNLVLPLVGVLMVLGFATRRGGVRAHLLLGLAMGLGALLRGNLLLLIPWAVALPLLRVGFAQSRDWRLGGKRSAWVAGGVVLALLPVFLRNGIVGGSFVLTTSGAGTNVYGGNNEANPHGIATEFDWVRGIPEHEADDWRREAERRTGSSMAPDEVSRYWLGLVGESLLERPGMHLRILWNKLRVTLGSFEVPDNHHLDWDARYVTWLRGPWPGFGVLGSLGLAGIAVVLGSRVRGRGGVLDSTAALELGAFLLLYLLTIVLTVTSMRVRLALVPMLAPFAGYALAQITVGLRSGGRGLFPWIAALVPAALFVHWPVFSPASRAAEFAERDFLLAVSLLDRGAPLEEVRAISDGLKESHGSSPRVVILGAEVDLRRALRVLDHGSAGELEVRMAQALVDRARGVLEACLEGGTGIPMRQHDRFRAQVLSGFLHQSQGRWSEALEFYGAARGFDPDDRDLRRRVALCLGNRALRQVDPARGAEDLERALDVVEGLLAEGGDDPAEAAELRELRSALLAGRGGLAPLSPGEGATDSDGG